MPGSAARTGAIRAVAAIRAARAAGAGGFRCAGEGDGGSQEQEGDGNAPEDLLHDCYRHKTRKCDGEIAEAHRSQRSMAAIRIDG